MTARYNFFHGIIRLSTLLGLIFFMYAGAGCRQPTQQLRLVWSGKQATGIAIPASLLEATDAESVSVCLENSAAPMLGAYQPADDGLIFKPLIPLSPGRQYTVFSKKKLIGRLPVPLPDATDAPEIAAFYPSHDTLPENLLKIYLQFSSPMREGEALQHIHLIDEKADTVPGIFLDLQPELWNPERTTLTVWLDPGRIKRDLIPNQRLGNPLKKGAHYKLVIADDWKSAQGLPLKQSFSKSFSVGERDEAAPQPGQWMIVPPRANTSQPLQLDFTEPLDYFLLMETVQVLNENSTVIKGSIALTNKETGLEFHPLTPWQPGHYRLRVAAYLEDLAGNNLNRLFDRDVTLQEKRDDAFVERGFVIR